MSSIETLQSSNWKERHLICLVVEALYNFVVLDQKFNWTENIEGKAIIEKLITKTLNDFLVSQHEKSFFEW